MVENSFHIFPKDGSYTLQVGMEAKDFTPNLELQAAVEHVIATIKPQPNIEEPERPEGSGPCYY